MDILKTVLEMLTAPQLSNLATITLDGKPWTRYVMVKAGDGDRICSAVSLDSRKIEQVENNPEVHITFGVCNPQNDFNKPYVQIQARATVSTSQKDREEYWFDMLDMVFKGPEDPNYAILVMEPYYIEYFMPGEHRPQVWKKE